MLLLGLVLTLAPYHGPALSGSVPGTVKFGVRVAGKPHENVDLRSVGLPKDWIASFCTNKICAPLRIRLTLPASGAQTIELQLVSPAPGSRAPRDVTVEAPDGRRATLPYSAGTRDTTSR